MFCKNCGTNVGDNTFCSNCGSKIISQTDDSQITPVEDYLSFGIEQPVKKKKEWAKIIGIVAAVLVIIGVAGYFSIPKIIEIVNPKSYAVAALKNSTSKMGDKLDTVLSESDMTMLQTPQEISMSFQLDKFEVDKENKLSDISEKYVTLTMQNSSSDNISSGIISIGSSSAPVITIEFYMDGSNIKFKIPALSSETFSYSILSLTSGTNNSFGQVSGLLGSMNAYDFQKMMKDNSKIVKAVVQNIIKGIDVLIENSEYSKASSETYKSENGDMKVSIYDVKITESVMKKCAKAIVNNMFGDKELSQYASVITMFTGQTKSSLLSKIDNVELGIDNIPLTVYINKNQEVVKTIFETTQNENKMSLEFIGKDNIYDYMIMNANVEDDANIKLTVKNKDQEFYIGADMNPPDSFEYENQFMNFGIQGSRSKTEDGVNIKVDKIFATGNVNGKTFDLSSSGSVVTKSISSVLTTGGLSTVKATDLETMTNAKKKLVLTEISKNATGLKGKLSDPLITEINSFVNRELKKLN